METVKAIARRILGLPNAEVIENNGKTYFVLRNTKVTENK